MHHEGRWLDSLRCDRCDMQLRHLVSEFKNLLPVAWHICIHVLGFDGLASCGVLGTSIFHKPRFAVSGRMASQTEGGAPGAIFESS